MMQVSQRGVDTIAHSEGCYLVAYKCPAGIWTVGYGHTSAMGNLTVTSITKLTEAQAIKLLQTDLLVVDNQVNHFVTVPLTQGQFDALVSFVFNIGIENFRKSTLLKKLNKGDYEGASQELPRWNHGGGRVLPGLTKRRHAEMALFNDLPQSVITEHEGKVAQRVDAPKKPLHPALLPSGAAAGGVFLPQVGSALPHIWEHIHAALHGPSIGLLMTSVGSFALGFALGHHLSERSHLRDNDDGLGEEQEQDNGNDGRSPSGAGVLPSGGSEPLRAGLDDR